MHEVPQPEEKRVIGDGVKETSPEKETIFSYVAVEPGEGSAKKQERKSGQCFDEADVFDSKDGKYSQAGVWDGVALYGGSQILVRALKQKFKEFAEIIADSDSSTPEISSEEFKASVRAMAEQALWEVSQDSSVEPSEIAKIGSTLTMCFIDREQGVALIAQVADSLGFYIPASENGEVKKVAVEQIDDDGRYIKDPAFLDFTINPEGEWVGRADIEFTTINVKSGDIVLNCTDGVEKYLLKPLGLQELKKVDPTEYKKIQEFINFDITLTVEQKTIIHNLAISRLKEVIAEALEKGEDPAAYVLQKKLIMSNGTEVSATEFADKTKPSNLGYYHDDMSLTITIV